MEIWNSPRRENSKVSRTGNRFQWHIHGVRHHTYDAPHFIGSKREVEAMGAVSNAITDRRIPEEWRVNQIKMAGI